MSVITRFASMSFAALLASGAALAQAQTRDEPQNPHSTMNKDRDTPD